MLELCSMMCKARIWGGEENIPEMQGWTQLWPHPRPPLFEEGPHTGALTLKITALYIPDMLLHKPLKTSIVRDCAIWCGIEQHFALLYSAPHLPIPSKRALKNFHDTKPNVKKNHAQVHCQQVIVSQSLVYATSFGNLLQYGQKPWTPPSPRKRGLCLLST
jgi:hypothetical protein